MLRCELTYDLFCPPSSPVPMRVHYAAMVEQAEYADQHGFDAVNFFEHHGVPENYLPSPLLAAAAVAARTRHVRLQTMVLVPFYELVKLAEDIAVVDLLSNGRADPIFAAGYVDFEFQMFGKDQSRRRQEVDAAVAFVRRAWTEDETELDGRRVRLMPKPVQRPHPRITMGGMSSAAARSAARLADDYAGPERLRTIYRQECVSLDKADPGPGPARAPFLHVSDDPERDWPQIAPFLLSSIGRYREWTMVSNSSGRPAQGSWDIRSEDELRSNPAYRVVTPDECVELIRSLGDDAVVRLQPGWGGQKPELGWSSLELFTTNVLPRVRDGASVTP